MLNKFKFAAAALAVLVATATFTASTEQAQAAKLTPGIGVAIGVGVGLVAGAVLGSRRPAEKRVYYSGRQRDYERYDASSRYDDDYLDDDAPRHRNRHTRKFDRYDD
jgi:hypothetical protein